jgi:hypothetical protein
VVESTPSRRPRCPAGVPLLARRGAGLAADAGVEIDDEAELFARGRPYQLRAQQTGKRVLRWRGLQCRVKIKEKLLAGMASTFGAENP